MENEIIVYDPLDMHVHFREGDVMELVVPETAWPFVGAVVMPNTTAPITDWEKAKDYRDKILAVADSAYKESFKPFMTL